jgi:hypothetical protein
MSQDDKSPESGKSQVSAAQELRRQAESRQWEEPHTVTLPGSGVRVTVRRPTRFYWKLRRTTWSRELVAKLDLQTQGVEPAFTADETALLMREHMQMVAEAFIEPCVSLEPGEQQFDTDWLDNPDADFLNGYLRGVLDGGGNPVQRKAHADTAVPLSGYRN